MFSKQIVFSFVVIALSASAAGANLWSGKSDEVVSDGEPHKPVEPMEYGVDIVGAFCAAFFNLGFLLNSNFSCNNSVISHASCESINELRMVAPQPKPKPRTSDSIQGYAHQSTWKSPKAIR